MAEHPLADRDLMRLFCELVDLHDTLADVLPRDRSSFSLDEEPTDADRVGRSLRLASLRKFIYLRSDAVYLGRVLKSVERLLDGRLPEAVPSIRRRWKAIGDGPGTWDFGPEIGKRSPGEIVDDFLNGGLLHGNNDKWQCARAIAPLAVGMSLWSVLVEGESLVRSLRSAIREEGFDQASG